MTYRGAGIRVVTPEKEELQLKVFGINSTVFVCTILNIISSTIKMFALWIKIYIYVVLKLKDIIDAIELWLKQLELD